ncbi:MAG: leucine-rich repeat protein, partial [Lachnospiraceae bacterium]|nr:leucine-rich repeat protein [Lachnospiraceae bacterium]
MYRKLKNILGVSLMVLAVVISQMPMPEAQAEIVKEMTEADLQVDDTSTHVVTFSMNGGTFNGSYNGYSFKEKTPVLVVDDGKTISSFPDSKLASYAGYKTEPDTWYIDKECLIKYDVNAHVTESTTLYKKWYNITSDGTTLADKGFHISADGTVLYQYDGDVINVEIPQTVTTIAESAFDTFDQVRAVTLPANINKIEKNAFSGVKDGSIIYIYDSKTEASKAFGKQLDAEYAQLVYSEYLDAEKTEKIAGIENLSDSSQETPTESKSEESKTEENKPEESKSEESKTEENKPEESKSEESETKNSSTEESKIQLGVNESAEIETASNPTVSDSDSKSEENNTQAETPATEESSSTVIVVEPDQKYTVTFDTGISDVSGEKREVLGGRTTSELVSVNEEQPRILEKEKYQIEKDDGKQDIIYTFNGWYKDKAYTTEWDFANDIIEQDTTIYAKWDKETKAYFTVTYNTTTGNEKASNIPEKQKLYADEKLVKPSKKPSMKDKTFKGWYTSETDTKSAYKSWGKPITENLTLYAHFEEKSNTVVFHMNGGGFTGNYNGTSYTDAASLTKKITVGKGISSSDYPESNSSASFKYSNYSTDSNWYTDKECLNAYSKKDSAGKDTVLNGDLTLYKKWYYTSSGFTTNTSGTILYKYSGSVADVTIPNTVTTIASDAFASAGSISSITLPDNISDVKENAFSGVKNVSKDITITGKSENARNIAKGLANQYTRLVYKDSKDSKDNNDSSVVSTTSDKIKLGATISGSTETSDKTTAAENKTSSTGTIALGADTTTVTNVQPAASPQSSTVVQPGT